MWLIIFLPKAYGGGKLKVKERRDGGQGACLCVCVCMCVYSREWGEGGEEKHKSK